MSKYAFIDCVESMSSTLRLADVRGISVRDAALLVLSELGWPEDGPSKSFTDQYRRGLTEIGRQENVAYHIAKAIKEAGEELGAPMDPLRVLESQA